METWRVQKKCDFSLCDGLAGADTWASLSRFELHSLRPLGSHLLQGGPPESPDCCPSLYSCAGQLCVNLT